MQNIIPHLRFAAIGAKFGASFIVTILLFAYPTPAESERYLSMALEFSSSVKQSDDTICTRSAWAANVAEIDPNNEVQRRDFDLQIWNECNAKARDGKGCAIIITISEQDKYSELNPISCAALAMADEHRSPRYDLHCARGSAAANSQPEAERLALHRCEFGLGCEIVYSECVTSPSSPPAESAAGLALSETAITVDEGVTANYTVALTTRPSAEVTVNSSSNDPGAVSVSEALTFTTENWNTAQMVTVTGVSDADDNDETVAVTHVASGGGYDGVSAFVTVEVVDVIGGIDRGVCDRTPQVRDAIVQRLTSLWESPPPNCQWVNAEHLASIDVLHFLSKGITSLKPGDFAGLSNLTTLNLTGNDLTALPESLFSELSSLDTLYLDRNDLTDLPTGVFSGLFGLETLSLSFNDLTTLRRNAFSDLISLRFLYLDSNNLLSGNQLTILPGAFFGLSLLEELHLDGSRLAPLPADAFAGLSNLGEMNLSRNNLAELPARVFSGLFSLRELNLSQNDLLTLPAGIFEGLSLEDLDLGFNPGAPFVATLTLFRTDNADLSALGPATVGVKLVAGGSSPFPEWPSAMPVPLPFGVGGIEFTAKGGTIAPWTGNTSTGQAEIAKGILSSGAFRVAQTGAGPVVLSFFPDPTVPFFQAMIWGGVKLELGRPLVLFDSIDHADTAPVFGERTVTPQIYTSHRSVRSLALPAAMGGSGPINYSISPALPPGLVFDSATRVLSGTPTGEQAATEYTYTATDGEGNTARLDFIIVVTAGPSGLTEREALVALYEATGGPNWTNNSNWLSDKPLSDWHGVIVNNAGRVIALNLPRNGLTGLLTPALGALWNLRELYIHGNEGLIGRIPEELGNLPHLLALYTSGTDLCLPAMLGDWYAIIGKLSAVPTCSPKAPVFGDGTIPPQVYVSKSSITSVSLPAATGGSGTVSYSINPALPPGLKFNPASRILSGTPTTVQTATEYTYTATDAQGNTARLVFIIVVNVGPTDREALVALYKATGGANWTNNTNWLSEEPLSNWYGVTVDGVGRVITLNLTRNELAGSLPPALGVLSKLRDLHITGNEGLIGQIPEELANLANLVGLDADDTGLCLPSRLKDRHAALRNKNAMPICSSGALVFDDQTIAPQVYTTNRSIGAQLLPAATGGSGTVSYSISSALPPGLVFDPSTRILSGTPKAAQKAKEYTYEATDAGGNTARLVFTIAVTAAPIRLTDREALVALYKATGGANWTNNTNWLSDKPLVNWHGVTGNTSGGHVVHLNLRHNGLAGSLPAALGALSNLQGINIRGNESLTGPLPEELGSLSDFALLYTSGTGLCLPPALRNWHAALRKLSPMPACPGDGAPYFGNRSVAPQSYSADRAITSVSLPAAAGGVGEVTYSISPALPLGLVFDPAKRVLSGTPTAVQAAKEYTYAATDAEGNAAWRVFKIAVVARPIGLTDRGALVALYGATGGVRWINNTNWLSNEPLGDWHGVTTDRSGRVITLNIPHNGLAGSLPAALGALSNLRDLYIHGNEGLTGSIPEELGSLSNLFALYTSDTGLCLPPLLGDWYAALERLSAIPRCSAPVFSEQTEVAPQSYSAHRAITSLALPAAAGGVGEVAYSISPGLPPGLVFDPATRVLSGTPTAVQTANQYTYTATDAEGNATRLVFTIAVTAELSELTEREALAALYEAAGGAEWTNNTNWLSDKPLGDWHGVTVYHTGVVSHLDLVNNGLTGSLPAALGALRHLWRLDVRGNRSLTGRIPEELGNLPHFNQLYTSGTGLCLPRALEDWYPTLQKLSVLPACTGGTPSLGPVFGDRTLIAPQSYSASGVFSSVTLPAATGGVGEVVYSINPALPPGLIFDPATRVMSGTPTAEQTAKEYTYAATDAEGNAAWLVLTITVTEGLSGLTHWTAGLPWMTQREALVALYGATGGMNWANNTNWLSDRPLEDWYGVVTDTYGSVIALSLSHNGLVGSLPAAVGVLRKLEYLSIHHNVGLTGRIPEELRSLSRLYHLFASATGLCLPPKLGDWHSALGDNDPIPVCSGNGPPVFDGRTVAAQKYSAHGAITGVTLPSAMGGAGELSYSISPALPPGLVFDPATRVLSGTPTAAQTAKEYTFFAMDTEGNAARLVFTIEVAAELQREALVALYEATSGADWTINTNWLSDKPLGHWHGVAVNRSGRVTHLSLPKNGLIGQLPPTLGMLSSLGSIDFHGNRGLTGQLPEELGRHSRLVELYTFGTSLCLPHTLENWYAALQRRGLSDPQGVPPCSGDGAPMLAVADASALEGGGEMMRFSVSLDRGAPGPVSVDYATADGTATAGADYTAVSGTLSFAPGELKKSVSVAILDDAIDEGTETFVLRLSNPRGAYLRNLHREAKGTIVNNDPLQKMWLSRFGRTVAGHVTDAVSGRLSDHAPGAHATLGGQTLDLSHSDDGKALVDAITGLARALGARDAPAPDDGSFANGTVGTWDAPAATAPARLVTGREQLLGSAFHLASQGQRSGPGLAAWGRISTGSFDGEEASDGGRLYIDGDVITGVLGADAHWDRVLAGVAVSLSEGEGTFGQPGVDSGKLGSKLAAVSPYARFALTERVTAWGLLGWGTGDMTITQAATETRPETITRTDIGMRLGAVGARGTLSMPGEFGGLELALRADAFIVRMDSEKVANSAEGETDGSRVRLVLEGGRAFAVGTGVSLRPVLELGVRHDGGDAESGTGVEVGGGVSYADAASGLSVEAKARTLVAHADSDYRDWGASVSVRLEPGADGRGLSLSLVPTVGTPSSATEHLWGLSDARSLAPAGGEFEAERSLRAEVSYGVGTLGVLTTPYAGLSLVEGGARAWRTGVRWTLGSSVALGFEGTRIEAGNDNAEHGMMLKGAVTW